MPFRNVKDFGSISNLNLNTDSILSIQNNELKRLNANNASLNISNVNANNLVYNTGIQNISGAKTFLDSGVFSLSGASPLSLSNNPLSIVGSGNTYIQVNIQNRATGTTATADLVLTANNGTDAANYINLGINNSGYNDPTFSNGSAYDGYLFINGGNLDIGTQTPNTNIEFHAGGTTASKVIARINESGFNIVSGNLFIPSGSIISGLNQYSIWPQDTSTASTSAINAFTFYLEAGRLYRCENFFRFSVGGANSFSDVSKNPTNSVWADGYRYSFNNTAGSIPSPYSAAINGMLVAGIDQGAGGFWGVLSGLNTHTRKALLRPLQNASITFTYGSHNGSSTTFNSGSYVLIEKIA